MCIRQLIIRLVFFHSIIIMCSILVYRLSPTPPLWDEVLGLYDIKLSEVLQSTSEHSTLWVDARSQERYEEAHIPDAIWCSEDDWEAGFDALIMEWEPQKRIIVYCDAQECAASTTVRDRLAENLGEEEPIFVLYGGWAAWKAAQP